MIQLGTVPICTFFSGVLHFKELFSKIVQKGTVPNCIIFEKVLYFWDICTPVSNVYLSYMDTKLIDLKDYELSGGGKLGESYIKLDDPDILLKMYPLQYKQLGFDEYEKARKAFDIGLPCPEPGELVTTADGRIGVQFKRIKGKKSYARAISEHPERIDQYAMEFSAMCKKLHSTIPEPGLFPRAKDQYIKGIHINPYLTDEEKKGLERFVHDLPDANTAVHGDLHHGNMIFADDGQKYFIDLSDLCIGSPLFDLGIIMLQTCWVNEEMEEELYHMKKDLSTAFWKAFVKAHFGPDADIEKVEEMLKPYAILRVIVTERFLGRPVLQIRPALHAMINK